MDYLLCKHPSQLENILATKRHVLCLFQGLKEDFSLFAVKIFVVINSSRCVEVVVLVVKQLI